MEAIEIRAPRGAPGTRLVRWALARKGADAVFAETGDDDPIRLACGDDAVEGVRPCLLWIESRVDGPSIYPENPQKRNQAATFAEFAESVLVPAVARLAGCPGWAEGREVPADDAAAWEQLLDGTRMAAEAWGRGALGQRPPHVGDAAVATAWAALPETLPRLADAFPALRDYVASVVDG